jgi:hypothetical protein
MFGAEQTNDHSRSILGYSTHNSITLRTGKGLGEFAIRSGGVDYERSGTHPRTRERLAVFLAYFERFFQPVRDLAQTTNAIAQVSSFRRRFDAELNRMEFGDSAG